MKLPRIGSLFKAAPQRNPKDAPVNPIMALWGAAKRPTVSYPNAIAAERALQHPIVYRALNKLASSVQQVRWFAEPDPMVNASEQAGAAVIKALNNLLLSPNDTLAPDQLRYWLTLTFAVYGRAAFKVGTGVNKMPNGIYPLDSRWVKSISDNRGIIKEYEYGTSADGKNKTKLPTRKAAERANALDKGYVYEIFTPNLAASNESDRNVNALGAIGLPSEIVEMLLQRAYDTASGHPNSKYIVSAEKTITEPQKAAIKGQIEDRELDGEEAGNILFISNTQIKVDKLDNDLSDIHSKMPLDDMARMIYGAFGIPISLVGMGAADGAKFAGNYKESRQSFWEDTIIPCYCTPIATGLTAALCPPGARISFDLDSIDAIQDSRVGRSAELKDVNFLTMDEKRELAGYPKLSEEQRKQMAEEAKISKPTSPAPAPVAK